MLIPPKVFPKSSSDKLRCNKLFYVQLLEGSG